MTSKQFGVHHVCFIIVVMWMRGVLGEPGVNLCRRDLLPRMTGDNGYKISVVGNPVAYKANEVYTVSISGTFPNQTFTRFVLNSVPRHSKDESTPLGTLQNIDPKKSKSVRLCPHVISHSQSRERKKEVEVLWTAPQTGSGCVEFRAAVGDDEAWYKDDGALTKIFCEEAPITEGVQNDEPRQQGECCACGSAKYEMTFEGLWSQESHPRDYPSIKRLLHWSNIVGASHSKHYRIWEYGGYATKGVKEICEFGYPRGVEEEVKKSSREVRTIIKTTGIWWKDPVGIVQNRSARFTTDRRRHFVSMITMLGPSPDWCVGVSVENLCLPNCTWSDGFVVDLQPWDAGTDNGITYMAPNSKTDPQQRIRPITNTWPNDAKSPFYGPDPIKLLARLRVEKLSPKEDTRGDDGICPDDAKVEFDFFGEGESAALDADKRKEKVVGGKCQVLSWEDWSGCSVTCGVGSRTRRRRYKHPEATESMCGLPVFESENCIGIENECETSDEECSVTLWSDWSPCSVTCGKGVVERRRYYLIDGDETRCNRTISQVKECLALQVDCAPIRKSHEICTMPSLRGPCRGNFQRWYYDRRSKKCLPFQYGGCRGNGNRFETMDECLASCAEDDEDGGIDTAGHCLEPSESGTCGKRIEMWYFDKDMLKCLPFVYSGCGGNRNRFKTMGECTETCRSVANSNGGDGGRCSLPSVPGTCRDVQERWYFDTQMQKCLPFDYGGCQGNENNFRTMDECTESCQLSGGSTGGGTGGENRCTLPSERGPCRENHERWYFDTQMQKCLPFDYSGCGGNVNNFQTMDECTESCHLSDGGGSNSVGLNIIYPSARCGLPSDEGPCRANLEKWYFDMQMQKCLPFDYGGCGGNANNFQTMDECTESCQPKEIATSDKSTNPRCSQPFDSGPCRDIEERWYFDTQMQKCLPFDFGGCNGNSNNFRTMDECTETCQSTNTDQSISKCTFPSDRGPCTREDERWYFDSQMGKCLSFTYGGCAGNDNNFETMDKCTESCSSTESLETKTKCFQPPDPGPCRDNLERWYFDAAMEKCLTFEFGGCDGNENNYKTMDECSESCQSEVTGSTDSTNRCTLPYERGPCRDDLERWYFDVQMNKCIPFDYGGCGGNDNNFQTMDQCTDACQILGSNEPFTTTSNPVNAGRFKRFCTFPKDRGLCGLDVERWYFDLEQLRCLPFHYSGCAGNANNFQTEEECSEMCRDSYDELNQISTARRFSSSISSSSAAASSSSSSSSINDRNSNVHRISYQSHVRHNNIHINPSPNNPNKCNQPPDVGPCFAKVQRWYFDPQMEKCLPFDYGGCLGNDNNFQDMYTCLGACHVSGQRSPSQVDDVSIDKCSLPTDTGPCRSNLERWHYEGESKSCRRFQYGGCGGNENNFHDYKTCAETCKAVEDSASSTSKKFDASSKKCRQPIEAGPCTRISEKWYYDANMGKCLTFQYGGCGGNDNRFDDFNACIEECQGRVIIPTQSSSLQSNIGTDKCFLNPDRGSCLARIERWYFNVQLKRCLTFQYGGCGGNGNSFQSYSACNDACQSNQFNQSDNISIRQLNFNHQSTNRPTESNLNETIVHCRMGPWSEWSPCSPNCGSSHRMKQREVLVQPSSTGKPCSKMLVKKQRCKVQPCQDECQYTQWTSWSACIKTCGYGSFRQRIQKPVTSSSSSSSSSSPPRDKLKCAERVQRALCETPKCSS